MEIKDPRRALLADRLTKEFVDQGKIIEAGWVGLRLMLCLENAPEAQQREMRKAFMAGAQHLFASVMVMLDPGSEATERDLMRMELIHQELEAFRRSLGN